MSGTQTFILRSAGLAIVVASSVYVVYQIFSTNVVSVITQNSTGLITTVVLGTAAYAVATVMLAVGWSSLLEQGRVPARTRVRLVALYGSTQIAKYIPGNIFHFISRHAFARSLGYSHLVLARAAVLEGLGLIAAAAAVGVAGAVLVNFDPGRVLNPIGVAGTILLVIALYAVGVVIAPRLLRNLNKAGDDAVFTGIRSMLTVGAIYILFFIIGGAIAAAIAASLVPISTTSAVLVAASAAIAWLAGFVVPGAGAGIGVRESVLILALADSFDPTAATAVAVLYRVVTMSGDVVFALAAQVGAWGLAKGTP